MPSPRPIAGYGAVAGGMALSEADAQQTAGTAMPSPVTSAWAGLTMASHQSGLQSGGLYGYSTFFTGYRPGEHGAGRRFSVGRAAAEGVSLAAQGLRNTPLSNIDAVDDKLQRATQFSRYGLGVFGEIEATTMQSYYGAGRSGKGAGVTNATYQKGGLRGATQTNAPTGVAPESRQLPSGGPHNRAPKGRVGRAQFFGNLPEPDYSNMPDSAIDDTRQLSSSKVTVTGTAGKSRLGTAGAPNARAAGGKKGGFIKKAIGLLGGSGYTDAGEEAFDYVKSQLLGGRVATAQGGSAGANVMKGAFGRSMGMMFRFAGYAELARMGGQAFSYAAGEGYESLVETTESLQRRVGGSDRMSTAYYNRAASTERQRAVQAMDSNRLDPRSQIQGNEAYFMHG